MKAVNLIIGENDTGKSYLLKLLYVLAKGLELAQRHKGVQHKARLSEKLLWTFQPPDSEGLRSLIRHGAESASVEATIGGSVSSFTIQRQARNRVAAAKAGPAPSGEVSAVFIPSKEVLTSFSAIATTREVHEMYGFDDTSYDLIKSLRIPSTRGEIDPAFQDVLLMLDGFSRGTVQKAQSSDDFTYARGALSLSMPQTADGIKKIGIITTLLRNRVLSPGAILLADEPETNMHPRAITLLVEALFRLAQAGAQVFMASHSYFVIKKLQLLAKRHGEAVGYCSLRRDNGSVSAEVGDLLEGMPDNPIIDESIRLYEEEVLLDLGRG